MNSEIILTGKWLFIGAERFIDSQWQPCDTYVDGMTWEFCEQYIGEGKVIGSIVETSPSEVSTKMAYAYNSGENRLTVEIFTECTTQSDDSSEADIYEVCRAESEQSDDQGDSKGEGTNTITISILTQHGCPPPYFRYILQKQS